MSSPTSSALPGAPEAAAGWRARVDNLVIQAARDLESGDMRGLKTRFDEPASWDDPQRAYQARSRLADLVLAFRPTNQQAWMSAFATAAAGLMDALEREPREPVLLNAVGVLLFELTEHAGAEAMFKAALRLDPEMPHTAANLESLRKRNAAGVVLGGAAATQNRLLGKRAQQIARRAQPVQGLTLSLCMIVKDEAEMLPGCLAAVKDAVDEMIVVDTGSSDATAEIARSFGAKVVEFPWNGSFADARNVSLDHATSDWVIYLDADEHMLPEDAPKLRELLTRTWREGFYLVETNFTGGDDSGAAVTHHALRLWRRRPQYRFEGRIHEQKTHTMPTYLPERFETTTVRMRHYGYLRSRITAKDKSRRNIELLEIEARENPSPFNDYNLGSEYLSLDDSAKARMHFDRSYDQLRRQPGWSSVGYAPLLVARVAASRRGAGDLTAARESIAEGLEVYPTHTDLVMEAALCARAEGNLTDTARLAEKCLAMGDAPAQYAATVGSGTFLAMSLLADTRERSGDAATAEQLYRQSLAEHPDYGAPVLPLVSLMVRRGADEDELRAVAPGRPSGRLLAATAAYEAGNTELGEEWFRDVLELQPANGAARIGLVECLLTQRRFTDAAAEAKTTEADAVLAATAAGAELFALAAAGDGAELEPRIGEAEQLGVSWAEAELYRGWAAILNGSAPPRSLPADALPTANRVFEALLRVREVDGFVRALPLWGAIGADAREKRELMARMYFRRGFLESAADEWIAVATTVPDARALLGLSQVAVARGFHADAAAFAREAISLDPTHVESRLMLDAINSKYLQAA